MILRALFILGVSWALALPGFGQKSSGNDLFLARGPYLQMGTSSSVLLRWRLSAPADAVVRYGTTPSNLNLSKTVSTSLKNHEVKLDGLQPNTTYWYSVGTSVRTFVGGPEFYFRSAPMTGVPRPFRIWAFGDSGIPGVQAESVRDGYLQYAGGHMADVMVLLGDQAYGSGTDRQFQRALFGTYRDQLRNSVAWITRGNHELFEDVYYDTFTLPTQGEAGGVPSGTEAYYSWDYANVHFVCLDSFATSRAKGDAMYTWLESDLAATEQEWIIAYWHHPPYSKGQHNSDAEIQSVEMRQNFIPLFEEYGVDLILTGHSHSYERSFLLDGHHGFSYEFDPSMAKDPGDGWELGDGAYVKAPGPKAGAVYCVAGSAADVRPGAFDHPVMVMADSILGTLVIDVEGSRIDVAFVGVDGVVPDRFTLLGPGFQGTYCNAEPHSQGCIALMKSDGSPSLTSPLPFDLQSIRVRSQSTGALIYGLTPTNEPGIGGRLCVGDPSQMIGTQSAGGTGPCTGALSLDFNQHIQSGLDSSLQPGTVVYSQWWFTDGNGSALSEAIVFTINP